MNELSTRLSFFHCGGTHHARKFHPVKTKPFISGTIIENAMQCKEERWFLDSVNFSFGRFGKSSARLKVIIICC